MPEFYRRRLTAPDRGASRSIAWTDPTLVAGAGVDIFTSCHPAIRPEVDLSVALDGGHGYTVVNAMVNLVYHFEDKAGDAVSQSSATRNPAVTDA